MEYIISFLEGIITFVSPCLLPMLPVYITYFAGGDKDGSKALWGSLGFVAGFTLVFVAMGALAGTVGSLLIRHQTLVNIICGGIMVLFGLSFLGLFELKFFKGSSMGVHRGGGFFPGFLFGMVFSVGWTPCVGAFLGSALLLASQQGSALKGIFMLLSYSLGLGIPFVLSAVLIDYLRSAFAFIKRHYRIINAISGSLLILMGILMATGLLGRLLNLMR